MYMAYIYIYMYLNIEIYGAGILKTRPAPYHCRNFLSPHRPYL